MEHEDEIVIRTDRVIRAVEDIATFMVDRQANAGEDDQLSVAEVEFTLLQILTTLMHKDESDENLLVP